VPLVAAVNTDDGVGVEVVAVALALALALAAGPSGPLWPMVSTTPLFEMDDEKVEAEAAAVASLSLVRLLLPAPLEVPLRDEARGSCV